MVVSCSTASKITVATPKLANQTVYYFFRHAEVVQDVTTNDPILSVAGKQRALNYVNFFKNISVDAIYSTNFNRTKQTAQPLATSKQLELEIYNPYKIDYEAFKQKNKNKTVVVVGHSNTTPDFANKIIGKMLYSQMTEDNHSDIIKVVVNADNSISSEIIELKMEGEKK